MQRIAEELNIFGKISQSSCGEDILLWRYFIKKKIRNGFFIDIGAYHPKFFSNTWRLRKKLGFIGINIEPTYRIKFFNRYRSNDINIQCMVGNKSELVTLYYDSIIPIRSGKKVVRDQSILVMQKTLTQIVEENNVIKIDLLDIDIEGTEMEVLREYNWVIRPRLILIEDDKDFNNNIDQFLVNKNYKRIAQTLNNSIYESK